MIFFLSKVINIKNQLFCNCEDDAVTLVKLQLWPGSVTRPLVAFHTKLVALAESLLLECHVSKVL